MALPAYTAYAIRVKAKTDICPICYVDVNLSTLEEHLLRSDIVSFKYCYHPDNTGEIYVVRLTLL